MSARLWNKHPAFLFRTPARPASPSAPRSTARLTAEVRLKLWAAELGSAAVQQFNITAQHHSTPIFLNWFRRLLPLFLLILAIWTIESDSATERQCGSILTWGSAPNSGYSCCLPRKGARPFLKRIPARRKGDRVGLELRNARGTPPASLAPEITNGRKKRRTERRCGGRAESTQRLAPRCDEGGRWGERSLELH
jgi:hypothetical protein